jgi:hypothetical protein
MLKTAYDVAMGVDGNLHVPVRSNNRLNQTEPATFSIFILGVLWDFLYSLFDFYKLINLLKIVASVV